MDGQARNHVQEIRDHIEQANATVRELHALTLTPREQETLTELQEALEDANRRARELSHGGAATASACNTDCSAYARGTCGYINVNDCPRFKQIYHEPTGG